MNSSVKAAKKKKEKKNHLMQCGLSEVNSEHIYGDVISRVLNHPESHCWVWAWRRSRRRYLLACFSRGIFNENAKRPVRRPCYFPSCVVFTPAATFFPDVNKQTDLIRKLNLNTFFSFFFQWCKKSISNKKDNQNIPGKSFLMLYSDKACKLLGSKPIKNGESLLAKVCPFIVTTLMEQLSVRSGGTK